MVDCGTGLFILHRFTMIHSKELWIQGVRFQKTVSMDEKFLRQLLHVAIGDAFVDTQLYTV